jgi:hypothetical protein
MLLAAVSLSAIISCCSVALALNPPLVTEAVKDNARANSTATSLQGMTVSIKTTCESSPAPVKTTDDRFKPLPYTADAMDDTTSAEVDDSIGTSCRSHPHPAPSSVTFTKPTETVMWICVGVTAVGGGGAGAIVDDDAGAEDSVGATTAMMGG